MKALFIVAITATIVAAGCREILMINPEDGSTKIVIVCD